MPKITTTKKISNIDNFAKAIGVSKEYIDSVISLSDDDKYTDPKKKAFKKDGKIRIVKCPSSKLRKIQSRINTRIFKDLIKWPDFLYGSIPNDDDGEIEIKKDYISCASRHCEARSLLKIDISDFFLNIHESFVYDLFNKFFKYDDELCRCLVSLCCYKGTLVQGALTSSYIASLILWDVESNLVRRLERWQLVYTRLVDDITVSSKVEKYNFDIAKYHIKEMLFSKDLPINEKKTSVSYNSSTPLMVHGLRVSFKTPRLPSYEVKRIRSSVQSLELLFKEPGYNTSFGYRKDYQKCMGRVNKLARVQHNKFPILMNRLKKIRPKCSKLDVKISRRILRKLQEDYPQKKDMFWYKKQYYKLIDRINFISNTFKSEAHEIRLDAKKISPPEDD
ncbi:RNA-directed DNA polymerase [Photobacterium damselae]|uniref:reverse transcriptase family protein n=1 Tax=Photobacterium damselae TaxID=38293 RepID=UPI001EDF52EA|nr:reverse transcriptase family protein [Photobacterium damselae]MCG3814992.1 RNA-directed DNA polymerase [Photobacterium damselae]